MEDRDGLPGEEGIQDTHVHTVARRPGALLRRSMPHAQFPEPHEAVSVHHRVSAEGANRGRYRTIPAARQISQTALVTGVLREDSAV